ncbi:hypothetical protein Nepgr_019757 [Nepenthes gracilis]|uniref:PB1 domain-containing protein n=1 Tax=Nepenthes gracilis TaxID=150966 RepID=A0AAD3SXN8_NEPGR|nr:hypothetical protein Nepgr_019757 [Nepenthes gracilis]
MENYARSHPFSGDGTPRVINFDNQSSSREEQPPAPAGCKAKFMISYGGRIQPRPHDNQLSYVGGQTKILTVDRNIEFSSLVSKLSVLCNSGVSFKYQLPGEDLDALISVTNDDDLEQMMHEYNRLHGGASGPPRLRLFLFPLSYSSQQSRFGSGLGSGNEVKADRYRFVDALSSGVQQPVGDSICQPPAPSPPAYNVDFLFGLDKGVGLPQPPPVIKVHDPIPDPDVHAGAPPTADDGIVMSDSLIDAPIQVLNRLQISDQERQAMFRPKTDDSLVGLFPGDSYVNKLPEKTTPAATIPSTMAVHATYVSPEKNISDKGFTAMVGAEQQQQPIYVIPSPERCVSVAICSTGERTSPSGILSGAANRIRRQPSAATVQHDPTNLSNAVSPDSATTAAQDAFLHGKNWSATATGDRCFCIKRRICTTGAVRYHEGKPSVLHRARWNSCDDAVSRSGGFRRRRREISWTVEW